MVRSLLRRTSHHAQRRSHRAVACWHRPADLPRASARVGAVRLRHAGEGKAGHRSREPDGGRAVRAGGRARGSGGTPVRGHSCVECGGRWRTRTSDILGVSESSGVPTCPRLCRLVPDSCVELHDRRPTVPADPRPCRPVREQNVSNPPRSSAGPAGRPGPVQSRWPGGVSAGRVL